MKYPEQGLASRMHLVQGSFLPAALRSEREMLYGTDLCQWPNALEAKEPYLGVRVISGGKETETACSQRF